MSKSTEVAFAILAPIVAKPGKEAALAEFLDAGYDLSLTEAETVQWFALKYTDDTSTSTAAERTTFAIFDTFATTAGRAAHIAGPITAALVANAPVLLDGPPEVGQVEILANVVRSVGSGRTGGLSKGLHVLLEAKEGKAEEAQEFLVNARQLILAEPETPVWYAFRYPGTNKFGIVDFFASEEGRDIHLAGKVAQAVYASVGTLFAGAPNVVRCDVVVAKI